MMLSLNFSRLQGIPDEYTRTLENLPWFLKRQVHSRLVIEHPTSFEVIRTKVHQFDKVDEVFFLVGVEIGERTVFLVKYCGVETRYSVEYHE